MVLSMRILAVMQYSWTCNGFVLLGYWGQRHGVTNFEEILRNFSAPSLCRKLFFISSCSGHSACSGMLSMCSESSKKRGVSLWQSPQIGVSSYSLSSESYRHLRRSLRVKRVWGTLLFLSFTPRGISMDLNFAFAGVWFELVYFRVEFRFESFEYKSACWCLSLFIFLGFHCRFAVEFEFFNTPDVGRSPTCRFIRRSFLALSMTWTPSSEVFV